jgi:hypothetical protein
MGDGLVEADFEEPVAGAGHGPRLVTVEEQCHALSAGAVRANDGRVTVGVRAEDRVWVVMAEREEARELIAWDARERGSRGWHGWVGMGFACFGHW